MIYKLLTIATLATVMTLDTVSAEDAKPVDKFETVVKPFLKKNCTSCHGAEKQKGDLTLHDISTDMSKDGVGALWESIMDQLRFDEMPPEKKARPDKVKKGQVLNWIQTELENAGRFDAYRRKLLRPEYGNYVNHDMLFSGEIKRSAFSPTRLWRISPYIFQKRAYKGSQLPYIYSTLESGLRDYAPTSLVDQGTVEVIINNISNMFDAELFKMTGGEKVEIKRRVKGKGNKKKIVKVKPNPKHDFAPFQKGKTPTKADMEKVLSRQFAEALGRQPSEQELKKYVEYLKKNIKIGGNLAGLKITVLTMYLSVEAIYRMEIGLGKTDEHGRRRLSTTEIRYAVNYALSDTAPEKQRFSKTLDLNTRESVQKLIRTYLKSEKSKKRTFRDQKKNPRIMRFFEEYFGYRKSMLVFKDTSRTQKEFLSVKSNTRAAYSLTKDLEVLIEHILKADKKVFETLLTTDKFFIRHSGNNKAEKIAYGESMLAATDPDYVKKKVEKKKNQLIGQAEKSGDGDIDWSDPDYKKALDGERKKAEREVKEKKAYFKKGITPYYGNIRTMDFIQAYNLPYSQRTYTWSWPAVQPVKIPNRTGILTHPAWLWAHSTNFDNDPIHRGKWIYEKLLGGVVQDVPPDVDARVPEAPHKTLRERMEVIRPEECWRCHKKMNPLGEAFEIFDDWGRHRTTHYFGEDKNIFLKRDRLFTKLLKGDKLTKKPINASGKLTVAADPKVNGEFKDAFDLIDKIAKSDRSRQTFIRYVFRYFMGRNEMLSDSKTLIEADQAYVKSGGSFNEILVSLLSSDSFLYRK